MQKFLVTLFLSLSFFGGVALALERDAPLIPTGAKDEVRIAIIDLFNFFASPKYRPLSDEINFGLRSELAKLFEMKNVSREGIQASFLEILDNNNHRWERKEDEDIKELAEKENLDYVIYFTSIFDKEKAKVMGAYEVFPKIYSKVRKKVFIREALPFQIRGGSVEFPIEKSIEKVFQGMLRLEQDKKSHREHPTSWQSVVYELGLNPFYQAVLSSTGTFNLTSGGLSLYSRCPFKTLGFSASSLLGRFFFMDIGFNGIYTLETIRNTKQSSQVYGLFGGLAYLHPFNTRSRLGGYIRVSYYLQLLSNDSRILRGLFVPVGLELDCRLSQHFAFNLIIGDQIFIDRSITHGLYASLGFAYLIENKK